MHHFAHRSRIHEDRNYYFRFKTFEDGTPRNYGEISLDDEKCPTQSDDVIIRNSERERQVSTDFDTVDHNIRVDLVEKREKRENKSEEIRRRRPRVSVLVVHWMGWSSQSVCKDLRKFVFNTFEDKVAFYERVGPTNAFEVFINGRILYSRLEDGGFPSEEDLRLAISRVLQGRDFLQVKRSQSEACVVL